MPLLSRVGAFALRMSPSWPRWLPAPHPWQPCCLALYTPRGGDRPGPRGGRGRGYWGGSLCLARHRETSVQPRVHSREQPGRGALGVAAALRAGLLSEGWRWP